MRVGRLRVEVEPRLARLPRAPPVAPVAEDERVDPDLPERLEDVEPVGQVPGVAVEEEDRRPRPLDAEEPGDEPLPVGGPELHLLDLEPRAPPRLPVARPLRIADEGVEEQDRGAEPEDGRRPRHDEGPAEPEDRSRRGTESQGESSGRSGPEDYSRLILSTAFAAASRSAFEAPFLIASTRRGSASFAFIVPSDSIALTRIASAGSSSSSRSFRIPSPGSVPRPLNQSSQRFFSSW